MRLIFRVTLAITAIFLCVMYTRKITSVSAQVFSESCSQLDNDCISNGGTTSSCETQYNDCMAERQSDCRNNTSPACQTNYSDSADGCVNSCNPNGGCSNPPPTCPNAICDNTGGTYFWNCGESPIIIDVAGRGFRLTDAANGVLFDFPENGQRTQVAWTDPQYGNAWLALDRNGNGIIDNATELFGNFTPQPQTSNPNGFLALGVYDDPANGGNGDGFITSADSIYSHLLLWTDTNHNGMSEPSELRTLADSGIKSISINYREAKRVDQYGNSFRYKSHIKVASRSNSDRLVYDVFLTASDR